MSNLKTNNIKLYTEEQVIEMIYDAHNGIVGYDNIFKKQTPIELPSDEEIDKEASTIFIFGADQGKFIAGAKWMKEQIIKKANEK